MNDPLAIFKEKDSAFYDAISAGRETAFSDGALSAKDKLLIGTAIDLVLYAENGVRSLAMAALNAGAKKEEIIEVVRVANFISGVGTTFVAANALKDILNS